MSKTVKTEKVYRMLHSPGEVPATDSVEGVLQSYNEYDKNGNLILEMTYNSEGGINEKNEYRYDDSGRPSETIIYGDEDEPLESRTLHRDDQGNVIKEEILYLDGSVDTIHYRYQDNSLKEKTRVTDEEEVEAREVFSYDGENMLSYERYNEDNQLVYKLKNTFENDVLSETEIWMSEDGDRYKQVIQYNEHGRREVELRYDAEGRLMERNTFEEDEQGKVIRLIEENRAGKNTTEMTYDEQGRLIAQEETDLNGNVVSQMDRDYDDEGRPSAARVLYMERRTTTLIENYLVYEYDYFED